MPTISKDLFISKIGKYFPPEAWDFVFFYFDRYTFSFKVTNPRVSKKGDFRFSLSGKKPPVITINGNLCTYEFLLVYIHELAHLIVFLQYPKGVRSHGKEWKTEYGNLLSNALKNIALPQDITLAWEKHLRNIKSSSASDPHLTSVFDKYRDKPENECLLKEIAVGECFVFRNELFCLNSFARTRATCTLIRNKRKYLISGMASVLRITK